MDFLRSRLMEKIKMTALVNAYSALKLPLLAFLTPRFSEFSEELIIVKVRLGYRSRNHLGSMYFGALAVGSELSIAAAAVDAIQKSGKRIDFVFKAYQAEFLKRPDNHVLFTFDQVREVHDLVQQAASSTERLERTFHGTAKVEGKDEIVMKYQLTLSVKNRS